MKSFRTNLRTYVDEKDISLENISEQANISVETLKTLLYGKSNDCKLSTAVALARALEISIDELVGAGTIDPMVCESIQITRNLPDMLVYFLRWAIRYHEKMLKEHKITTKAINVMQPEFTSAGNLVLTNNFDLVDFPNLPDAISYKVFMGFRIPSDTYMPAFAEGDILLLANDRNPLQNETVLVSSKGYAKIVKRKEEYVDGCKVAKYYSIRNNSFLTTEADADDIIGYVAKTIHKIT